MIGSRTPAVCRRLTRSSPLQAGQLQIGEHQVAALLARQRQPFLAGVRGDDRVAFFFEHMLQRLRGTGIIFDNQDCARRLVVSPAAQYRKSVRRITRDLEHTVSRLSSAQQRDLPRGALSASTAFPQLAKIEQTVRPYGV